MNNQQRNQAQFPPIMFIDRFQRIYAEKYQSYFKEPAHILFTNGYCYHFARLLNQNYQESQLYYSANHVRCRIGNYLYDINGDHDITDKYQPSQEAYDEYYLEVHFTKGTQNDSPINQLLDEIGKEVIESLTEDYQPKTRKR